MSHSSSHAPPDITPHCRRCGGSGMLRHGDQRFRTCLDCLGQGRRIGETAEEFFFRPISVAVSLASGR
ncbi:hypothetical protein NZK33_04420 [Cyanobium sp. FGCU-6]|nr:hypothetical protein [Cyanobium sp. FGCU6]